MRAEIEKHVSIEICSNVSDICKIFFGHRKFKIEHLNYIQKHDDGTIFYLCGNPFWLLHYYKNLYPCIGAFEQEEGLSSCRYILWDDLKKDDPILEDSKELLNMEHGITIVDKFPGGIGFYNLSKRSNCGNVLSEFVNHLEDLNQFVSFFKEKSKHLVKISYENRFVIPKAGDQALEIYSNTKKLKVACKNKKQREGKRTYLGADFFNTYFTTKELECVEWYVQGKNALEISEIMKISKRTVETHIENVKAKLNCTNLCQVGYTLAKIKRWDLGYIP